MPSNQDVPQRTPQEIKEEQRAARNLRRRTRYAQMSPERKQNFLFQLRVKRAESKKQRLSHNSSNAQSSVEAATQPQRHASLAIDTSALTFEEGSTSSTHDAINFPVPTVTTNRGESKVTAYTSRCNLFVKRRCRQ